MNDITPKEANEILRHYTDLGYGVVIEGDDTTKIKQALDLARETLTNGTPYNPSGDLISREALKEALKSNCKPELCHDYNTAWCESCCPHNDFEDLIDNAPTVEPRIEYGTDGQPYKLSMTNGKEYERPQDKWIDRMADKGYVECSFCHKQITGGDLNFCVKCGADMRKGGAE